MTNWGAHQAIIRGQFIHIVSQLKRASGSLISQKEYKLCDLLTQHKDNLDLDLKDKTGTNALLNDLRRIEP